MLLQKPKHFNRTRFLEHNRFTLRYTGDFGHRAGEPLLSDKVFKITLKKTIRIFITDLVIIKIIKIGISRSDDDLITTGVHFGALRPDLMQKHNIGISFFDCLFNLFFGGYFEWVGVYLFYAGS